MNLWELTWEETKNLLKETQTVILPVGSTEQHGFHLPVNNDIYIAVTLSQLIAKKALDMNIKIAVSTPVAFGLSTHHMSFPGSITLTASTFENLIREIIISLISHGFKNIIIVNGHGGNSISLNNVVQRIKSLEYPDVNIKLFQYWDIIKDNPMLKKVIKSSYFCHGCEAETSLSLVLGQKVYMTKAVSSIPKGELKKQLNIFEFDDDIGILPPIESISKSGVIGDPTLASQVKGEILLEGILDSALNLIT